MALDAEHLHSPYGQAFMARVMLDYVDSLPETIPMIVNKDGMDSMVLLKVRVRSTP